MNEDMPVWKQGIYKVNGETFYATRERRFALRTTQDEGGRWYPVWVFESMRPPGMREETAEELKERTA